MASFRLVAFAALLSLLPHLGHAEIRLTLCNRLDGDIRYATLDARSFSPNRAVFSGWRSLGEGECLRHRVPDDDIRHYVFASDDPRLVPITPERQFARMDNAQFGDFPPALVCVRPSDDLTRFDTVLTGEPTCAPGQQKYRSGASFSGGRNVFEEVEVALLGSLEALGVTPLDTGDRFSDAGSPLEAMTKAAAAAGIAEGEISTAILSGRFVPNHDDLIDAFYALPGPTCDDLARSYRLRDSHPEEPVACFRALVKAATCLGQPNPACGAESPRHAAWTDRFGPLSATQIFETAKRDAYRASLFQNDPQPRWTEDDATLEAFAGDPEVEDAMTRLAEVSPIMLLSWPPDIPQYFRCHYLERSGETGSADHALCQSQPLSGAREAEYGAMLGRMGGTP